jgi:hypothetical protein
MRVWNSAEHLQKRMLKNGAPIRKKFYYIRAIYEMFNLCFKMLVEHQFLARRSSIPSSLVYPRPAAFGPFGEGNTFPHALAPLWNLEGNACGVPADARWLYDNFHFSVGKNYRLLLVKKIKKYLGSAEIQGLILESLSSPSSTFSNPPSDPGHFNSSLTSLFTILDVNVYCIMYNMRNYSDDCILLNRSQLNFGTILYLWSQKNSDFVLGSEFFFEKIDHHHHHHHHHNYTQVLRSTFLYVVRGWSWKFSDKLRDWSYRCYRLLYDVEHEILQGLHFIESYTSEL